MDPDLMKRAPWPWRDFSRPSTRLDAPARERLLLAWLLERAMAAFTAEPAPADARRELALLRRSSLRRALWLGARLTPCPPVEEALRLEQLEADLTAALWALPGAGHIRPALEFALLEEADQLYRFANLLDAEQERPAEAVTGERTEIAPGRPCVAAHRHPLDSVFRPLDFGAAPQGTLLTLGLLAPLQRLTASLYAARAGEAAHPQARMLFAEMALIEEQHATQYESLWDCRRTPRENLLLRARALGYAYHSLLAAETEAAMREIYAACLGELRADVRALNAATPFETAQPEEDFPPPFVFGDTSALVRALMPRQVTLTMLEDSLVPSGQLPGDCRYFQWQRALCGDGSDMPSHRVIARYAARYGTDYRFERKPSPIEALQNRRLDNTLLGRETLLSSRRG